MDTTRLVWERCSDGACKELLMAGFDGCYIVVGLKVKIVALAVFTLTHAMMISSLGGARNKAQLAINS